MSNKSITFAGNSRGNHNLWNQTSGTKALMLRGGLLYNESASGATGWASIEAPDTFVGTGTTGIAGPLTVTEAKDTFTALGGVPDTGVWTDTEPADKFQAYIAVPPVGTWASTEAPDFMDGGYYGHQPRFEVESVISISASDSYSTAGPNRIVCVIAAFGAAGTPSATDQITGITDSAGNVWRRQDVLISPPSVNHQYLTTEMWWSYAKNQITGGSITITTGGGFSFTHNLFALVSIKGLGGNFNNPFSDTNPYSYGGDIGAFFSAVNTQPHSNTPVATGPLSPSGSVTNPITFDPASIHNVSLDVTDLKVTSTGSGGPNNYATIPYSKTLTQGKIYIEAKFVHIAGSKYGFGVTIASDSTNQITDTIANGGSGTMIRGDGTIWIDGVQIADIGCIPADGDIIGIALDFDNGIFWARDVTQNSNYNSSASALPAYGSAHYGSGGSNILGDPVPDRTGSAHSGLGGAYLPFANVDGTSSSAEMDLNFGQSAFVGTPPAGYQAGWGTPGPAVTPTRVEQHAIVLGWSTTNPDDDITQFPPGFALNYTHIGDISAGIRLTVYSKVIAQNILTTDNEFMTQPTATSQWAAVYDTIVSDIVSPGTLESTEAPDTFHAVGYGPGGAGIFGYMTTSEARDTAAFLGAAAVVGQFNTVEIADSFSAYIRVNPVRGTFDTTEAADRFAGTGIGLGEDGVWMSTEGLDTLTINGVVPIAGTFDTSETADRFQAIGAGVVTSRRRRRRNFVT